MTASSLNVTVEAQPQFKLEEELMALVSPFAASKTKTFQAQQMNV